MAIDMKQIGDDMMIRIMQYCDGTLAADEARVVAAEIEASPELQQLAADLNQGASLAREAMSGIVNDPIPLHLVRGIVQAADSRPAAAPAKRKIPSFIPREVAAALIGLILGGAAIGIWSDTGSAPRGLRLAGLPESAADTTSAAFKAALMGVLNQPDVLAARKYVTDPANGNEGEISVVAWFNLADGSQCAELRHIVPMAEAVSGIACKGANQTWDVLLRPSAE